MKYAPSMAELYRKADELISSSVPAESLSKTASTVAPDADVVKLADALTGAEGAVEVSADTEVFDMDKVAESLNVIEAAAHIEILKKTELFEKRAKEEGYSDEQIRDALQKAAAAQTKKNLPIMVALGLADFRAPGTNSAYLDKSRMQGDLKQPVKNNAETQGY